MTHYFITRTLPKDTRGAQPKNKLTAFITKPYDTII